MKKYLIFGLVSAVASINALAASGDTICSGANPQVVTGVSAGTFVQVAFTPKCSNNVILQGSDQGTYYAVASGSTKGKNVFIGSSAGGGIVPDTSNVCATTGCVAGKIDSGLTNAIAISS